MHATSAKLSMTARQRCTLDEGQDSANSWTRIKNTGSSFQSRCRRASRMPQEKLKTVPNLKEINFNLKRVNLKYFLLTGSRLQASRQGLTSRCNDDISAWVHDRSVSIWYLGHERDWLKLRDLAGEALGCRTDEFSNIRDFSILDDDSNNPDEVE